MTLTSTADGVNNKIDFIEVTTATTPRRTFRHARRRSPSRSSDGEMINYADVHMDTPPFSDPNLGDTHRSSDWQVHSEEHRRDGLAGRRRHVHLRQSARPLRRRQFVNSLAGKSELPPDTDYMLRVRHRDSSGASNSYSAW